MFGLSARRIFLIARRDYVGYIKTWGFWLSFLGPLLGMAIGFFFASADIDITPQRVDTIVDRTGAYESEILALYEEEQVEINRGAFEALGTVLGEERKEELLQTYDEQGLEAARESLNDVNPALAANFNLPEPSLVFADSPANSLDELMPYLMGERMIDYQGEDRRLNGALIVDGTVAEPNVSYWSENFNNPQTQRLAQRYFRQVAETNYLSSGGLSREGLEEAQEGRTRIEVFDPRKPLSDDGEQTAVSNLDRIPYGVAAGLSVFLWLSIFSGAYMLLTSMLEEKMNKLLEMMLASTKFEEIIIGKLIGVAALTLTTMAPYLIGAVGLIVLVFAKGDPAVVAAIRDALPPQTIFFFVVFLILGYLLYGAFFIALGAMSQSMQDAQTLTTPIVLILTLCVLVVPVGLNTPDSPLLTVTSYIPFSAPFAAMSRMPSDPPIWELILSAGLLALLCAAVIILAAKLFRYGVLSGGGIDGIKRWFSRTILRRA